MLGIICLPIHLYRADLTLKHGVIPSIALLDPLLAKVFYISAANTYDVWRVQPRIMVSNAANRQVK